ncbi:MAG TPA: universal stress protein, partial [Methylophaga sp.]|nr:universal stress protein [Methylophaga sp.]
MKKILCATDGSHSAEKAVEFAVEMALLAKAELTFIHVIRPTGEDVTKTYFWDSTMLRAADEQIQRELQQAFDKAQQKGLGSVSCTTVQGHNVAA